MCLLTDLNALKPQDNRAKLTNTVPLKVTFNLSQTDILVQIASYMSENQLHPHSCNNELVNPPLLEITKRLRSIQMDWKDK